MLVFLKVVALYLLAAIIRKNLMNIFFNLDHSTYIKYSVQQNVNIRTVSNIAMENCLYIMQGCNKKTWKSCSYLAANNCHIVVEGN